MRYFRKYICLLLHLLAALAAQAQDKHYSKQQNKAMPTITFPGTESEVMQEENSAQLAQLPVTYCPVMPQFPGDINAFISNNFNYPDAESEIGGRTIVQFIVCEDGSTDSVKIIKSISPAFDAEVLRVIRLMPLFTPAKQEGKPIVFHYWLPITICTD